MPERLHAPFWPRGLLIAMLLLAMGSALASPPRMTLQGRPDVSVVLNVEPGACPATLPLRIESSQEDDLVGGSRLLSRAMAWAQLTADSVCPASNAIQVHGVVGARTVYQGTALRSDGWALTESAPAPVAPVLSAQAPAAHPSAQTASAPLPDTVRQCDVLGAHPDDPEAVTDGVADNRLNAKGVIQACEAAVKADPATPRLHFQLARGYLEADRFEDAVEELILAAQEDHGAALAYLADLHLDGAPGIEADPALARQLYEKAAASGFAPAKAVLADFKDMTEEYEQAEAAEAAAASTSQAGLKPFKNPKVIDNIIARRFDEIPYNEAWVKRYLAGIADNIQAICESGYTQQEVNRLQAAAISDDLNIGEAAMGAGLLNVLSALATMQANPMASMKDMAQREQDEDAIFTEGLEDTAALLQRHICNTPGLAKFNTNLKAFVLNEEAPAPRPNAMMSTCMRDHPSSKYPSDQYCMCFLGKVKNHISQAERKALMENFKATAFKLEEKSSLQASLRPCRTGF